MSIFYKKSTLSCNRPLAKHSGFTLLEILLVIGIIAVLAGIVIIAINPSKTLATVRNTERKSDLKQIDSALSQYYIDNNEYPASLTSVSSLTEICDTGSQASSAELTIACDAANLINLSELVPKYLTAIPRDPSATTTDYAGYKIIRTGKKIGLSAPGELGVTIKIGDVPTVVADYSCGVATDPDCWSADNIAGGYTKWSAVYEDTGADSNTNGSANQEAITGVGGPWDGNTGEASNYPAFAYCEKLTAGYPAGTWYLPSKQQLTDAYGVVPGFRSHYYWSSTEGSGSPEDLAWFFYMGGGLASRTFKDTPGVLVRCFR